MFALLDLDETLVDRSSAFETWADRFAEQLSLARGDREWLTMADQQWKQRGEFFTQVHERFAHAPAPQQMWDDYATQISALARPHPGVMEALATMKQQGWSLAVVTNGRQDNQEAKLHATGIAPLLEGWAISDTVGARKPDPQIFLQALRLLGTPPPHEVFMVGDDPSADIAPAMRLGLQTAWVHYDREWPLLQHPTISTRTTGDALLSILSRNSPR